MGGGRRTRPAVDLFALVPVAIALVLIQLVDLEAGRGDNPCGAVGGLKNTAARRTCSDTPCVRCVRFSAGLWGALVYLPAGAGDGCRVAAGALAVGHAFVGADGASHTPNTTRAQCKAPPYGSTAQSRPSHMAAYAAQAKSLTWRWTTGPSHRRATRRCRPPSRRSLTAGTTAQLQTTGQCRRSRRLPSPQCAAGPGCRPEPAGRPSRWLACGRGRQRCGPSGTPTCAGTARRSHDRARHRALVPHPCQGLRPARSAAAD